MKMDMSMHSQHHRGNPFRAPMKTNHAGMPMKMPMVMPKAFPSHSSNIAEEVQRIAGALRLSPGSSYGEVGGGNGLLSAYWLDLGEAEKATEALPSHLLSEHSASESFEMLKTLQRRVPSLGAVPTG